MPSSKAKSVRLRFPPSPTGAIHLGNARTALINWLFTRQNKGVFVLRIEDTDEERSRPEHEKTIIDVLTWLGLDWDEGIEKGGPHTPYRQSERTAIYKKYLEQLLGEKKIYFCYCTKEELEAERQAMMGEGLPPKYGGHCRNLKEAPAGKSPQAIRFRMPETKIEFKDLIRGNVAFDTALFGDVIIARSLTSPLYNFAVAIDDAEMGITHVVRGEEHLSNTPKQILILQALGFKEPIYAHLPLILAKDRKKLSKRYAETSLLSYRDLGYLPEAIVNFLVLLGWHPQDDREIFTKEDLIKEFDLKRVQKAGAIFDEEKLSWLNQQYLKKMSVEEIAERLEPFLKERKLKIPKELLHGIIRVEKDRMKTLKDFFDLSSFFLELPEYDAKFLLWQNDSALRAKDILERVEKLLTDVSEENWRREHLIQIIGPLGEEEGRGSLFWPFRVGLSGQSASPDPLDIAEVLGKKEAMRRLKIALGKLDTIQ